MKTLFIDTTNNKEITINLTVDKKKYISTKQMDYRKSQIVLQLIERLLKKHSYALQDLSAIEVVTDHGSFTGIRVGLSIANTLGWVLNICVNGKPVQA